MAITWYNRFIGKDIPALPLTAGDVSKRVPKDTPAMTDYTSKVCTRCKTSKPVSEFSKNRRSPDGYSIWCLSCYKDSRRDRNYTQETSYKWPKAESTALAQKILDEHNIPACTGTAMNRQYIDLLAWACVPVEAKLSRVKYAPNRLMWSFTDGQIEKLTGVVMLIAEYPEWRRIFIVPAVDFRVAFVKPGKAFGHLSATPDSRNSFSPWYKLSQYEDRYDLIEVERLTYAGNKAQIEAVER